MITAASTSSKAFVVQFKELRLWSVGSFFGVGWQWPQEFIKPLSAALNRKQVEVDKRAYPLGSLKLVTLHFDGMMEPRDLRGKDEFKGKLYLAHAGDVIYSKIDVRNGAIGVVPNELTSIAVSGEYPVYEVLPDHAIAEYVKLVFRTAYFRRAINSMISGTSGRKRVQPGQIESLEVPFPPLETQRAIVVRWQQAQAEIAAAMERIGHLEEDTKQVVLQSLGLERSANTQVPKYFALPWRKIERWSVEFVTRTALRESNIKASMYNTVPLMSLCHSRSGGTPSKRQSHYWNGTIPWVSPKDMKSREIWDTRDHISNAAIENSSAPLIQPNSILLVVRSGILQRIVPVAINRVPVSINQDMRAYTLVSDRLLPEFLASFLEAKQGDLLKLVKWSTTVQSINTEDLDAFPIPVPPLDIQREIVRRVEAGRAEIAREREAAARWAREAEAEVEALILGTKKL
ncbi:MAG TPA: restriction endonuclease subunit S [Anaerolineae bacterium]|nr:restriction endonuclease subunit S [Anaerolineae bacterium]